jgi:hypothetical protein
MVMSIRLLAFVILLMPGWIALLKYYIFNSLIIRNIEYGKGARYRNVLDVYLPPPHNPIYGKKEIKYDNGVPVVVFVSGGAWIIGYKLWSALMGREFARRGYVVVVPDYRNFPQGNIEDMIQDLSEALRWTVCNSEMFGGDPKKIVLAGQSAGAHISLCTIIELYETHLKKERQQRSQQQTQQKQQTHQRQQQLQQQRHNEEEGGEINTTFSHFPHIDTATVLISSLTPLPSAANCALEVDPTDQTDIDQSLPSSPSSSPSSSASSPLALPTHDGSGVWWDVDTPNGQKGMESDDELVSPSSPSRPAPEEDNMEILWDNSNETQELLEPLSDGLSGHGGDPLRRKKPLTSPVDNLDELLTQETPPLSPFAVSPSAATAPAAAATPLPLEINLLGSTEFASDVINDTAKQNVDESDHDLQVTDITLFIGISGPYNMVKLLQHLHFRGLDASLLHHVFNSNVSLYSPVQRLNRLLKPSGSSSASASGSSSALGRGQAKGSDGREMEEEDDDENILKQTYNQFYSYLFNVKPAPATTTSASSTASLSSSATGTASSGLPLSLPPAPLLIALSVSLSPSLSLPHLSSLLSLSVSLSLCLLRAALNEISD